MRTLVLALALSVLAFGRPALAQQFTNAICVSVSEPVLDTLHVVGQFVPTSPVLSGVSNTFAITGTSFAILGLLPVYGSASIVGSSAHFALTVGAASSPPGMIAPRPTLFLRGSIDLGTGQGSGLCEQSTGTSPCEALTPVTFDLCN